MFSSCRAPVGPTDLLHTSERFFITFYTEESVRRSPNISFGYIQKTNTHENIPAFLHAGAFASVFCACTHCCVFIPAHVQFLRCFWSISKLTKLIFCNLNSVFLNFTSVPAEGFVSIFKSDIPLCFRIIKAVKSGNTNLFVVFIATCYDPEESSSD